MLDPTIVRVTINAVSKLHIPPELQGTSLPAGGDAATHEPHDLTPTEGEQLPVADPAGRRFLRSVALGGMAATALLVGAYVVSLRTTTTLHGLKAGGQPIGDVPFGELDAKMGA